MSKNRLALLLTIFLAAALTTVLAYTSNTAVIADTSTSPMESIDTFSATGSIASVVFDPPLIAMSGNNTVASVLPEKTFILTGLWLLKVDEGKVTSFAAKFTKVHVDATNRHTHRIVNFHPDSAPVTLNVNDTMVISGTVDVLFNGAIAYTNVKTTILIDKLSTIAISLDPAGTDNHFKGQSIYGVVNSLKDKDGRPLITFPRP